MRTRPRTNARRLDDAAFFARPMLRLLEDRTACATRFAVMPRVFFVMLPVFAASVAFYRADFPGALIFAVPFTRSLFLRHGVRGVEFTRNEHLAQRSAQ